MAETVNDRPMGWLPDPPGALPEYETLFGLDTPQSSGACEREPWTDLYQEKNSCTWNGAAHACYGLTGEKCSPCAGYWAGLAEKYPEIANDPNGVMPDEGFSFSQILNSYTNSGLCKMELWHSGTPGFHPLKRPPWAARVDSQRRNLEVSAVFGDIFAALACAIDRKHFALLALDVDDAFLNFTGDGLIGPISGTPRGGHLVSMWNHEFARGEALIGNYWRPRDGVPWGMGNKARISSARIAQARAGFIITEIS